MSATAECSIAVAVPATLVAHEDHSSLGDNVMLESNGVSPQIMAKTSKTLFSIQSDVAELALMVIKAAGIAALYQSDEESRIAIATSFATVKLADKGFSMAGRLLIPGRGADDKEEEVVSANLAPLHELLDQYECTDFDVDSIVSGTALEFLVSAAKDAARAAIDAAKAANVCSVSPTAESAMALAQAAANTSAKAARLNTAALEVSSSFL